MYTTLVYIYTYIIHNLYNIHHTANIHRGIPNTYRTPVSNIHIHRVYSVDRYYYYLFIYYSPIVKQLSPDHRR